MGLKDDLKDLVGELNRIHSGAFSWSEEFAFPDFVTAENGKQRHFTSKARFALRRVSETLHTNRPSESVKIEIASYENVIRQVVADLHARDEFADFYEKGEKAVIGKLKALAEERLPRTEQEYTHYFPAWTVGMEKNAPLKLGPVTFLNRIDWIDLVDFSSNAKVHFLGSAEANFRWKDLLKDALKHPLGDTQLDGLASPIYGAICNCPALLSVTIRGYEKGFSRKLAKLVCKTALDSISLALGAPEFFHQQALYEERLPPIGSESLMESNGYLWLPGISLGKRIPHLSMHHVDQALVDIAPILPALASILDGLVTPAGHPYPKLANRWATALDWFGEGNRESNDPIAVAKLGTCLDVLACGGKNEGISQMVINLTGTSGDTLVVQGDKPLTLRQLVKEIYEDGRSKILHGTHFDRLKSFERERQQAAFLARIALIECARRLLHYSGNDSDIAFRTMAPVPN